MFAMTQFVYILKDRLNKVRKKINEHKIDYIP